MFFEFIQTTADGAKDKSKSVDSEKQEERYNIIAPIIYINRSKLCVVTWNRLLYIPNPESIARLPITNIIIATREKENKLSRWPH